MNKELRILLMLSFLLIVGSGLGVYLFNVSNSGNSRTSSFAGITLREEFERDDSPSIGPRDAAVTIVEFLDPECESCRAFFPTMKSILKDYEGRVRFVVRYMPFHSSSLVAIAATEAAGVQGKYWEMQELLFNLADEWGHQPTPRKDLFIKYAQSLRLDLEKFKQDLEDPKWIDKAQRDMSDGKTLGVQGTPTLFVNGDRVRGLTYQAVKRSLEPYFESK